MLYNFHLPQTDKNRMQSLKARLPFLLILFAIYAAACSSSSSLESNNTADAAPDDVGVSEDDCERQQETNSSMCFTAIDSVRNCRRYTDNQSLYRVCEFEVSYNLQSHFERASSIEVECEVNVDYMSRFGWKNFLKLESSRHALDPQGTVSGVVDFEFRFSRNRRVTEVKDSVACTLVSTYEY
jgi:hypothetical protein